VKLPEQIKCGAFVYEIKHEPCILNNEHAQVMGQARILDLVIKLDDGMTDPHARETLLHEVIHVIEFDRHLDLAENDIFQLSKGLAQVLLDNPELTRLFLAGVDVTT